MSIYIKNKVTPSCSYSFTGVRQPQAGLVLGWVSSGRHSGFTDPECRGWPTEWLCRLGMLTTPLSLYKANIIYTGEINTEKSSFQFINDIVIMCDYWIT